MTAGRANLAGFEEAIYRTFKAEHAMATTVGPGG